MAGSGAERGQCVGDGGERGGGVGRGEDHDGGVGACLGPLSGLVGEGSRPRSGVVAEVDRHLDLARVTADVGAVLQQDVPARLPIAGRAREGVPVLGVAGNGAQGAFRSGSTPRQGGRKRNAWIAAISAASDTQNVKTAGMVFTVANPLDFALAVPAVTNLSIVV